MNLLPRSLRARLLVIQAAALVTLWAVLVGITFVQVYRSGEGAVDQDLRLLATAMARLATPAAGADPVRLTAELADINAEFSEGSVQPGETAFQVWTRDGRALARIDGEPRLRDLPPGTLPEEGTHREPGWIVSVAWNRDRTIYAVAAQSDGVYRRVWRGLVVQLGAPLLLLALGLSVVLALTIAMTLRPLRRLAAEVEGRTPDADGPLTTAVPFTELTPVVKALNDQFARVASMVESERRFFADGAHELRTPLAVIAVQCHVLAHETDADARQRALATVERGLDRAARVVSRMLAMGRLQAMQTLGRADEHDLAAVTAQVIDSQRERARVRGSTILLVGEQTLLARFDRPSIGIALENLIDNALAYSHSGATVVVELRRRDGAVELSVTDDGPGIAEADRERAFERFERLGRDDGQGSGLGLAIVRRVASLHGGYATLAAGPDGTGTRVELRWPDGAAAFSPASS